MVEVIFASVTHELDCAWSQPSMSPPCQRPHQGGYSTSQTALRTVALGAQYKSHTKWQWSDLMVEDTAPVISEQETEEEDEDAENAALLANPSDEIKALRSAIVIALTNLAQGEHIEIAPDAQDALADEVTLAGMNARTPRHALKKLRNAVIDSDHVEEVYADNRTLELTFRRAMGG